MKYWWVNQNQTFKQEIEGGYLWSPKKSKNNKTNPFYETMTRVSSGDIVFSFYKTLLQGIGIINESAKTSPKPSEFGSAGDVWSDEGWLVPTTFLLFNQPIRPKDHYKTIAPLLPEKYGPLNKNFNGNQGIYLTELNADLAHHFIELLDGQVEEILSSYKKNDSSENLEEIKTIISSTTETETQKSQVIKSRVGQGLFRSRVSLVERKCRVTGIDDPRFLIASHIKPWAASNNIERLDRYNGLLLAPHIDHLFDSGFITFDSNGNLIRSNELPNNIEQQMLSHYTPSPKELTNQQEGYMKYHRQNVFKH